MEKYLIERKVKKLERAAERNNQEHKEIFEGMEALRIENDALRQLCRALEMKVQSLMLVMEQLESIQDEVEAAAEEAAEAAAEAEAVAEEIEERAEAIEEALEGNLEEDLEEDLEEALEEEEKQQPQTA